MDMSWVEGAMTLPKIEQHEQGYVALAFEGEGHFPCSRG